MPRTLLLARLFLAGGAFLLLVGLLLWHMLPVPLKNPPFFLTSLFACFYGLLCYVRVHYARRKSALK